MIARHERNPRPARRPALPRRPALARRQALVLRHARRRVIDARPERPRRDGRSSADDEPSGLGWLPDGRLLVVSMHERKLLRRERDGLVVHADLSGVARFHANDMVVDAEGRAYVGNFGFDLNGGEAHRTTKLALGRARRPRRGRRRGPALPERHRDHARRQHADRRRDLRGAAHRVRHRRRRQALESPRVGEVARRRYPTASASTPKARSGWRRRSRKGVLRVARRRRSACSASTSSTRPTRACSAATIAARSTSARPRTTIRRRRATCSGRIEAARVDVPGAGLP